MTTDELLRLTQARYDSLVGLTVLKAFAELLLLSLVIVFLVSILVQNVKSRHELAAALKSLADATNLVKEHGELTLEQRKDMDKTLKDVKKASQTQVEHIFNEAQQLEVVGKDVKEIKEVVKPSSPDATPSGTIVLHGPKSPKPGDSL